MDFRPKELLLKYQNASLLKRKQMELEEDCLLVNIMHNMIAFMLMANVDRISIRKKLQRLLAKSHTGLHYSRKINDLLNSLNYLVSLLSLLLLLLKCLVFCFDIYIPSTFIQWINCGSHHYHFGCSCQQL